MRNGAIGTKWVFMQCNLILYNKPQKLKEMNLMKRFIRLQWSSRALLYYVQFGYLNCIHVSMLRGDRAY